MYIHMVELKMKKQQVDMTLCIQNETDFFLHIISSFTESKSICHKRGQDGRHCLMFTSWYSLKKQE